MATTIPKMKLWYYHESRSIRCTWTIKELGLDDHVEHKFVDIYASPQPAEREHYHKTVHPHNTIPALEIEGGPTMLESTAICLYLADLCGRLAPEPQDRAEYYDWTLYGAIRLDEALERLWEFWNGPKDKQDPDVFAKAKAVVDVGLVRMENTLKDRPYILGQELTVADCILGFNIWWAAFPEMNNGSLLEGYPNVKAYLERVKARPALKATLDMAKASSN
ncbi:glutathione S-transferase GstA-like [Littorina saxatilis]|uniref:Glutathione S-transferase n=1 Tax=Littorina saxatilis TaxID=31220 RepID=A0AAN9GLW5_9CAEN